MYILPQFLEIETKKLLKTKLNKIIADITDDFIENLFVVNPDNKYQRNIFTIFGWLDFERMYYYDKYDRKRHFYFIDILFKIPAYEHYDTLVKDVAIDNAIRTNQKKGAETTNNMLNTLSDNIHDKKVCNISRQDIYNWLGKWNIPDIKYTSIESNSDTFIYYD